MSTFKTIALAGVLVLVAAPAFAQGVPVIGGMPIIGDLPIIGDRAAPVDLDPTHLFMPAAAPAPEAAPMMMKKHHMSKKQMMMKKKSM